jgi:hypothetical protein
MLGPNADPAFDMEKLVRTALDNGYSGWWGLEVGPRVPRDSKLAADERFELEIKTILASKALVERVVFQKS